MECISACAHELLLFVYFVSQCIHALSHSYMGYISFQKSFLLYIRSCEGCSMSSDLYTGVYFWLFFSLSFCASFKLAFSFKGLGFRRWVDRQSQ